MGNVIRDNFAVEALWHFLRTTNWGLRRQHRFLLPSHFFGMTWVSCTWLTWYSLSSFYLRASYSQIQPFAIVLGFRREAIAHRLHLVGVVIHISSHNSEKTRSPPVRRPSSPSLLRSKYLARSVRIPRGDISGHPATKGGVRVRGEGGGLESQNKSGKKLDLSHRGGGLELLSLWPVGRARMDLDR